MIISLKVIPNAKEDKIEKINENEYRIRVKEAPVKGKANDAVQKMLAKYFNVLARDIEIKNPTSRKKIVEIKTSSLD